VSDLNAAHRGLNRRRRSRHLSSSHRAQTIYSECSSSSSYLDGEEVDDDDDDDDDEDVEDHQPQSRQSRKERQQQQHAAAAPIAKERNLQNQFLIESKRRGMTYKEIRRQGGFIEAESTLRGRYRTLTKSKEARVRRPEWSENDVRIPDVPSTSKHSC
jgi:hypothetical protein